MGLGERGVDALGEVGVELVPGRAGAGVGDERGPAGVESGREDLGEGGAPGRARGGVDDEGQAAADERVG